MRTSNTKCIILFILSISLAVTGVGQDKFDCDGTGYFNYGNINQNGSVYISEYDTSTATAGTNITVTTQFNHNALGFNYEDSLLYVVSNPQRRLYRIDANGNFTDLGTISGWNVNDNIYAGDFDATGVYVVSGHSNISKIFQINVNSNPPLVISTSQLSYSSGSGAPDFADFAYNPLDSLFYGIDRNTGRMYKINAMNGVCTAVSNSSAGPYMMGACYFNSDFTRLMGHGRATSTAPSSSSYSCDVSTGICTLIAANGQEDYGNADGCGCNPFPKQIDVDPSSINEIVKQNVQFFPNPSATKLVNYSASDAIESIQVFSIDGRLIPAQIQSNNASKGKVMFENPGAYFISVRFKNGSNSTHQVIIL